MARRPAPVTPVIAVSVLATDSATSTATTAGAGIDSTAALAEFVQGTSHAFRIAGAGTWLDAGRPVEAPLVVTTAALTGIVEYVPGDLTLTVRSGTTLAAIDSVTASEGQWMGLDPAGSLAGTIGATVATASAGPLALGIGRVRDMVLGLEVVTGNGTIIRSGGKVVKNVAGFDIVRLETGAWGTLGIITEISLRLRALPEVDETVAVEFDARHSLPQHLSRLRQLTLAPLAVELLGARLARHLDIADAVTLVVRIGGNATRVAAQRAAIATLGALTTVAPLVWQRMRAVETATCAVGRLSHLPSRLAELWERVHAALPAALVSQCLVRASVANGTLRLVLPLDAAQAAEAFTAALPALATSIVPAGGHVVWEQLPIDAWRHVPSAVADALSSGLQRAFDPAHRCNPGILGQPLAP